MTIIERAKTGFLIFDGAFGTMLMANGLEPGENPTVFNLTHPDVVRSIHRRYLESGADVITLNTFSASRFKIEGLPYSMEELVEGAFDCARGAAEDVPKEVFLVYDIGPCGKLLEPMGEVSFDEAYEIVKEQALLAERFGADAVLLETMADLYELKAGLLAVRENTNLPVLCSVTIEQNGRTYTGGCLESIAATLEDLGADAIGINCSVGPKDLLPFAKKLTELTSLPILVQPNAGLPVEKDGVTTFDVSPEEYAEVMKELALSGVSILGGCCGTTPAYIALLSENVKDLKPSGHGADITGRACTPTAFVDIESDTPFFSPVTEDNAEELKGYILAEDYDSFLDIILDGLYDVDAAYILLDTRLLPGVAPGQISSLLAALQASVRLPFALAVRPGDDAGAMTRRYNGKAFITS